MDKIGELEEKIEELIRRGMFYGIQYMCVHMFLEFIAPDCVLKSLTHAF